MHHNIWCVCSNIKICFSKLQMNFINMFLFSNPQISAELIFPHKCLVLLFCYCIVVDYKTCTKKYTCCYNGVENYMARHINGNKCFKNCESYGRIRVYNGGPRGCTNPNTKGCTPDS